MASEDATRASFIHDKQRAQEDKDKARSLLLRAKELLRKSHGLVHAESKAQALFDRKKRQLKEEERKKRASRREKYLQHRMRDEEGLGPAA